MYRFAASDTIFDGVSNIYLISIATAFLAVIIALYCSNFLKDEREKQLKIVLDEVEEEDEEDSHSLGYESDEFLANVSTSESELENECSLKETTHKRLICGEDESDLDCNSGSDDDINETVIIRECHLKQNESVKNVGLNIAEDDEERSPVDGLVSKMKSNRLKELEAKLTQDQLEEERRIEREQLAAIFELLKKQEAELNMKEIDESELNAQLSFYR